MKRNSDGKYQAFYIEGIKVVDEILNSKKAIDILFIAYSKELLISSNGGETLLKKLESKKGKIELIEFSKNVFEYMVDTKTPQGVLAVLKIPSNTKNIEVTETLDYDGSYIIIDKVQDAGNLGTIIRSSLGFDIKNIAIIKPGVDYFDPKCIRASMGSIFSINIEYFSSLEEYKKKYCNHTIYAFMLQSKNELQKYTFKKTLSTLAFGNEATGLDKKYLDENSIIIKHSNKIDSLNITNAVSIALYEFNRQNY